LGTGWQLTAPEDSANFKLGDKSIKYLMIQDRICRYFAVAHEMEETVKLHPNKYEISGFQGS
jgi:hypothetical protein